MAPIARSRQWKIDSVINLVGYFEIHCDLRWYLAQMESWVKRPEQSCSPKRNKKRLHSLNGDPQRVLRWPRRPPHSVNAAGTQLYRP